MSNLEEKTYYLLTHDGEPVLYGNNIRLHPCKEDIKRLNMRLLKPFILFGSKRLKTASFLGFLANPLVGKA
jgi:hypothetical protein